MMGRLAGEAIARSRLVDGQRDSRRRLDRASARVRRIQALSAELARAAGSREIARAIVEQAVDEVRAGVGLLYLARPDGRSLQLVHSRGYPSGLADRQAVIDIDAPVPVAVVARTARRVVVGSWSEWRSAYPGSSDVFGMTGTRSLVALPIRAEGEIRAVLVLLLPVEGGPAAEDLSFLELVCEQGAQALERARLYEALADRDRRLELTLGASRTGTWELDIRTGELILSEEFRRLHGLPDRTRPAGLEGYVSLVAPGDRDRVRESIQAAVESGSPYELVYQIDRPDGARAWVQGVGRVFFEEPERGGRIMGTERDTTAQLLAEAERDRLIDQEREARLLQEAFVGVVSHELRTPITTLLAGSKILRRDTSLSDRARDLALDVEEEADRLYRLVEDLLVLTRLERGSLEVGVEPVHLRHLITRIVAAEQARWPVTRFLVRHDGATHLAKGEETYVEQVLRNLLANAAKYSPPGSTVQVVLEPRDGEIAIRVLDEGPGIEAGEIDQLFTLFYRSPRTAAKASGAGIGLFVCNRLVMAMGGRTWARRRRGVGSEFGFALKHYEDVDDWPDLENDGSHLVTVGEAVAADVPGSGDRERRHAGGVPASSG
jgi:K+-sensing histidine kinase KdpD